MRKPTKISLLFLSMLVTGCDESPYQRDFYKSKEDCLKDWNTESYCEEGTHHAHGSGYYGPHYYYLGGGSGGGSTQLSNGAMMNRSSNHAVSSAPTTYPNSSYGTTRGGFGSTGRSYGGGISS